MSNEQKVIRPFKFRGKNTFYFKKKRRPLESLRSMMAFKRTCLPGGGGSYSPTTGDGEAWHNNVDRSESGWLRKRKIKAGQWGGPWIRVRNKDILST